MKAEFTVHRLQVSVFCLSIGFALAIAWGPGHMKSDELNEAKLDRLECATQVARVR